MPHAIVEWTDNLEKDGFQVRGLLQLINAEMRAAGDAFPTGGIRVRAIKLTDYVVADGEDDYAFVNITFKIGKGRSEDFKKEFFTALFERVKAYFAEIYARRYLALSLYFEELESPNWKQNNIHAKFKKAN
ncbi:MAG: 5-carboxymethyl-2-hydroxymuconate isomerase [Alphaproteobacteria bacterium]|nr:5-carboxymethyl-2-hydroxymuconate isomerase [Alphaproteobacteria bacterium]MDE2013185.1 5-carboxymethyl-2-hydroxymuconate Delta-isomerase [Alphaproteobacteria bacterium]MDE2073165.1 5-carboxymethyl-2-hydroxymuconate Delta-isomerase [Alphaproteobacteria bacterium]